MHWNTLILGMGEVGTAISEIDQKAGCLVKYIDPAKGMSLSEKDKQISFDIVHICVPFKNIPQFEDVIREAESYCPRAIIINSTIPPFFNESRQNAWHEDILYIHAPIRATHPNMVHDLFEFPRIVAPFGFTQTNADLLYDRAKNFIREYYTETLHMNTILFRNGEESALSKLINTTWYAMQIAFANQIHAICGKNDLDFEYVYTKAMETDKIGRHYFKVNERAITLERIPRPVMVAGKMGGHCLLPNIELLKPHISPLFYHWLKDMNEYGETLP